MNVPHIRFFPLRQSGIVRTGGFRRPCQRVAPARRCGPGVGRLSGGESHRRETRTAQAPGAGRRGGDRGVLVRLRAAGRAALGGVGCVSGNGPRSSTGDLASLEVGLLSDARDQFARASELAPREPAIHANLAIAQVGVGNDEGATAALETASRPRARQRRGGLSAGPARQFQRAVRGGRFPGTGARGGARRRARAGSFRPGAGAGAEWSRHRSAGSAAVAGGGAGTPAGQPGGAAGAGALGRPHRGTATSWTTRSTG